MIDSNGKISAFPKIWALGTKYAQGIFDGPVEITEKLDGSQFAFMWDTEDKLVVRSKGQIIDQNNVPDLFQKAVTHLQSLPVLAPQMAFYAETICRPRHNTLTYDRIPESGIVLFAGYDADDHEWLDRDELCWIAKDINVDLVPLLFRGETNEEEVMDLLGKESAYGGAIAEGVVIKAYKDIEVAGKVYPVHSVKVVTEQFKEKHIKNPEYRSSKNKAVELFEQFNSEARFQKIVQKLKESGQFTGEYRDIGPGMKLLNQDLEEECQDDIKDELYKMYRKDFIKIATRGFPEWFKSNLSSLEG